MGVCKGAGTLRLLIRVLTRSTVLVAVLAGVPSSAFAASGWQTQNPPAPSGASGSTDYGIACRSSTFCMTAGWYQTSGGADEASADRWNGRTWAVSKVPGVGGAVGTELDGGVSCASSKACVAVGDWQPTASTYSPLGASWNGTTWSVHKAPSLKGWSRQFFLGVSCWASNGCLAVGFASKSSKNSVLADEWTGGSWKALTPSVPAGASGDTLTSVSCAAVASCVAVGDKIVGGVPYPLIERWSNGKWSIPGVSTTSAMHLDSVSCTSAEHCMVTGARSNGSGGFTPLSAVLTSTKWTLVPMPDPFPAGDDVEPMGLSCSAASMCAAAGQEGYVSGFLETWNGSRWKVAPLPLQASQFVLWSASCTKSSCDAAGQETGGRGLVFRS